jgi:lysozyme family protein
VGLRFDRALAEVSSFDAALERTLKYEGGYVNNPLDSGGATNYGITQRSYDTFRATSGKPKQAVDLITDDEVRTIYHDDYWKPCNCDGLPDDIAAAVFDMAVNSGVWNAKIALQRAVRVQADGVVGENTIRAVNATQGVLLAFLKQRAHLIGEILISKPSQAAFAAGWISRLLDQAYELRP